MSIHAGRWEQSPKSLKIQEFIIPEIHYSTFYSVSDALCFHGLLAVQCMGSDIC